MASESMGTATNNAAPVAPSVASTTVTVMMGTAHRKAKARGPK